jgi:UDP-N-acetylmuramoyl-tripeptide--D-alanyl-D-alanine ligase
VENALCTFAVLQALGFDWKNFVEYLRDFRAVEGRFKTYQMDNWFVIDDAYNANPPSVRKALQTLCRFKGLRIAVLGDMLELGRESEIFHREVGRLCAELGIDLCLFYGPNMRYAWEECVRHGGKAEHFEDKETLTSFLLGLLNKPAVVLFKGSRGMRLEDVLHELQDKKIRI